MIRILLLILTLVPSILFSQFTITTTSESWDKEKKKWKPFEDFDNAGVKNIFTRVFKKSVKKEQLLWHKDRKDRKVKVIYGTGWKLQYDNQLPTELEVGQNYYINKNEFHRLHKGNGELKLEIKEYE